MKELQIKIKILDRVYPLKVNNEEEAILRKAGKELEAKLRHFKEVTGAQDKQDLIAMVAFDLMVEHLGATRDAEQTKERLKNLTEMIGDQLSTS